MNEKSKKSKATRGSFYFGIESDRKELDSTYNKKQYTFSDRDKVPYSLYTKGEDKVNFSGINKEHLALAIYESLVFKEYRNFFYAIDKKNYLFVKAREQEGDNSYIFDFEVLEKNLLDGENENDYLDNYYDGYPYHKVTETIKKLKGHKKLNMMIVLLFTLLSLMLLYGLYVSFLQEKTIKKVKPPRPYVAPMNIKDKNAIKNNMSIRFMKDVLKRIDKITKESDDITNIDTTRFSTLEFREYNEIPQEEPYYDEPSNTWIYSNEKAKKGGFEVQGMTTIQKVIADVNFEANEVGVDDIIYQFDEGYTDIVYAEGFTYTKKILTKPCLVDILELNSTIVLRRGENTIDFSTKEVNPVPFLKKLKSIAETCPLYFKTNSVVANKFTIEYTLYRDKD